MTRLTDFDLLSFDVYGTLIDWETGVISALQPMLASNGAADRFTRRELLEAYSSCEKAQQTATPDAPYSEVVSKCLAPTASRLGLTAAPPTAEQAAAFGASVGDWPAFPDSVEALGRLKRHFRLAVLSNVDHASFARSNAGPLQGFPFDAVITAQDVGTYKPDLRNFDYMLREVGDRFGVPKERVLQTAQSQFHDHRPARALGIRSSWIVRPGAVMGNLDDVVYDWKYDTLRDMADAVDAEVAAK
ncbi:dehalogenase [Geosmithia morbida]|uniref:Dehalogenase n=1 Tax=Geosmithia morbida TaxID=1094350 RepID=A0A9P4Z020_9HYPO|nr:dehalogenase [Geosmithia morbida]KAF4124783.1 dehalogenase [Geosmithia morbida]